MGGSNSVAACEDPCDVPLQPPCEPRCEPPPCRIDCCTRVAWPYIGWIGWIAYILEAVVVLWLAFMLIGVAPQNPYIIFVLLLGIVVFDLILWIGNIFYCAPKYGCCPLPCPRECPMVPPPVILRGRAFDYACKLAFDLRHGNDQWHLQESLMGGLFALFFFGLYVGLNGVATFNPLPDGASGAQITAAIIAKCLILMALGAIGLAFHVNMTETHSDFMWRHFTAINEQYKEKNEDQELALGNQASYVVQSNSNNILGTGIHNRNNKGTNALGLFTK